MSCSAQAGRCLIRNEWRSFSQLALLSGTSFRPVRGPGVSDASITEEVANDFQALFAKYPNVRHVFFDGSKAEAAFRRRVLPALLQDRYVFARLPSTSPAHAAMQFEAKVQAWSAVKKGLS